MIRILNVVGARPNFMKVAPIQRLMAVDSNNFDPILIHTGQHYDERMSQFFFNDLGLPEPDVFLGVGSGSHAEQTARIMIEFEKVCLQYKPDLVLVVGDVNSTAACSLVAGKLWIPVAHVEAGLRSFDRKMPEELNRLVTDALSDFLFVTESSGEENLRREGIDDSKIYMVGNCMIDSLAGFLEKAEQSAIMQQLGIRDGEFVLVTLHRPSNVDEPEPFQRIFSALAEIQKHLPVIFPIHPRTRKNIAGFGLENDVKNLKNLHLTEPLGYLDFIKLQRHCKFVLTDSGGLQEESTWMGIPCLTVRENTERPVTVTLGTNEIVGTDSAKIIDAANRILSGNWKKGEIPPLWDGHAAERIVKIFKNKIKDEG